MCFRFLGFINALNDEMFNYIVVVIRYEIIYVSIESSVILLLGVYENSRTETNQKGRKCGGYYHWNTIWRLYYMIDQKVH